MEVRENISNTLVPSKNDKQKWWQQITEYSLIVIFILMFITMSLSVEHFFSIENMLGLALSISQIGMVACTMMFWLKPTPSSRKGDSNPRRCTVPEPAG